MSSSVRRVVVVGGACGVGKSETLRTMRRTLQGSVADVATLETDRFYMIIDPDWAIAEDDAARYYEVAGWLLQGTAQRLIRAGFDWVAIGSADMYEESRLRDLVQPFLDDGVNVHHVTLDPGVEIVCDRIARRAHPLDADKTPDWIASYLSWYRGHYADWTWLIDNSALTPEETALAIFEAVQAGRGRIT